MFYRVYDCGCAAAVEQWENARGRVEQEWGSAPWGGHKVESWVERVSQQRAGQDPQVRETSKAAAAAKIELRLARERQPLEARGLARQVFRDDSGAQFVTAESGERRAVRYAEQWRDRAADARAEAVELGQLPTDQAVNRVQTKHQAAAEQAARDKQLARERAERLRQHDPYRPQPRKVELLVAPASHQVRATLVIHTAKVLERNTMRPRTITTAVCAALALVLTPAVANAAVPDELFEQTATVDAVGVNVESLPEYPAINAIATPDSGPQEVEFSIDAGAYRGPEGERIEVAKAATYTCILSVDNPHWSSGAGSVIAKPRVACKGPTSTVAIRVLGYLGKTSQNSISSLTIVAQSDYTQNVTVTSTTSYGPKQTWYVPKQGSSTKISRGAYFRGSASASPAPPLLPFNIPGSASAFLWVS